MTSTGVRTRWAAIGAAIAVSLGAGGLGLVQATSPAAAATFVPITPCRVADTRPDSSVGDRSAPLGSAETMSVSTRPLAGGGAAGGQCAGVIPAEATGVSLNVTAVGATLPTFLTIWPTGDQVPHASSLNPTPGAPPTPNAVMTGISSEGQFDVFNRQGQVHVVIDINGYLADHHHDDRYVAREELAASDQAQLVVGAEEFVANHYDSVEYQPDRLVVRSAAASATACLTAPAHVPHGAELSRLRARLVDDVPQSAVVEMMSYDLSSTSIEQVVAVVSTGLSTQLRTFVTEVPAQGAGGTVARETFDTLQRRYLLVACLPTGTALSDVVVNYEWPG